MSSSDDEDNASSNQMLTQESLKMASKDPDSRIHFLEQDIETLVAHIKQLQETLGIDYIVTGIKNPTFA
jgi:hypothetical protein